jgi:hypothetical protein
MSYQPIENYGVIGDLVVHVREGELRIDKATSDGTALTLKR